MEREKSHQGRYSVLSEAAARVTLWVAVESPRIAAMLCVLAHQPELAASSCGHTPITGICRGFLLLKTNGSTFEGAAQI